MKRKTMAIWWSLAGFLVLLGHPLLGQTGGGYDLSWHVVAGGGASSSTERSMVRGTAGQADAGRLTGAPYTLLGGFWGAVVLPATVTPTASVAPTNAPTATPTNAPTPAVTPTPTTSIAPVGTATFTPSQPPPPPTATATPTFVRTPTATATPTPSATPTPPSAGGKLSALLTAEDASLWVEDINPFPDSGTVQIDDEVMTYDGKEAATAAADSNTGAAMEPGRLLNLLRGRNGTTPAAHEPGAPVVLISACIGDCSADTGVTVDEILTMVNIALGSASLFNCEAADANSDGQVTVNEILTAVNNALNGCPHSP